MTKETILASIVRELERQRDDTAAYLNFEHGADKAGIDGTFDLPALAAAIERDLALKWMHVPPAADAVGFYWFRPTMEDQPTIAFVSFGQCHILASGDNKFPLDVPFARGAMWTGPIARPLKPPEP